MKLLRIRALLSSMVLLGLSCQVFAADLLEVYQQAQQSDPTFKAAEAAYLAARENLPINQAALLPNVSAVGTLDRNRIVNRPAPSPAYHYYNTSNTYTLSLTQPLFNFANWMKVSNAWATVKQAEATYNAAQQDLMLRVATAYFNVLQAYDNLLTTQAQEAALAQQLEQTEQRYKVGLIAITGVQQIKANYDATVAQEIAARNTLSDKLEELRAITGVFYPTLAGLKTSLPLVRPVPDDINAWVNTAGTQNYTLQAANFAMIAAQKNVSVQNAGHLPTVNAVGSYEIDKESNAANAGYQARTDTAMLGVNVTLPVYQGGLISAQTRQAADQYAQSSALREQAYRATVTQTRESYLGVISGISKIEADKQALISNETALKATQAAYMVGTNTIVDVLVQQSNLYTSQQSLTADQYAYLISTLNLKQAAGTLSEKDLGIINSWLGKEENFAAFDATRTDISYTPNTKTKAKNTTSGAAKMVKPNKVSINKLSPNIKSTGSLNPTKNYYVIQLFRADDQQQALDFVNANKLQDKTKTIYITSRNRAEYAVIYGNYATNEQAKTALHNLPGKLQKNKPWIREWH